jgi:eukaryotic translation initiation factor 2C
VANSPDYAPFKLRCTELGIGSQALQDRILRKDRDVQTQVNVAMKINTKLHGFNFRLQSGSTGGFLEKHAPLIFGADLTHTDDKPSLVAMVASMHNPGILYEEMLGVEKLREPPAGAPGTSTSFSPFFLS